MLVVHGTRIRVGQDPTGLRESATISSLGSETGSRTVRNARVGLADLLEFGLRIRVADILVCTQFESALKSA